MGTAGRQKRMDGRGEPTSTTNGGEPFSFELRPKAVLNNVPLQMVNKPMITVWKKDGLIGNDEPEYLVGVAVILPKTVFNPDDTLALPCSVGLYLPSPTHLLPTLRIMVSGPFEMQPVVENEYGVFYGHYEWNDCAIQSVTVVLDFFDGVEATADVTDVYEPPPNGTPVEIRYRIDGIPLPTKHILPPSVSFDGTNVNVALLVPKDKFRDAKAPQVMLFPARQDGQKPLTVRLYIQGVVYNDSATEGTLFMASYPVPPTGRPVDAVHAVIKFDGSDPGGAPGPRGTYVAVMKPVRRPHLPC